MVEVRWEVLGVDVTKGVQGTTVGDRDCDEIKGIDYKETSHKSTYGVEDEGALVPEPVQPES